MNRKSVNSWNAIAAGDRIDSFAMDLNRQTNLCFASPIVVHNWPDSDEMNAELRRIVLEEAAESERRLRSNVGGWSSDKKFLQRDNPAIRRLLGRINMISEAVLDAYNTPGARQLIVSGWANMLRPGGYNRVHNHANATWSGVYYVTGIAEDPNDEFAGRIEFIDPRPRSGLNYSDNSIFRQKVTYRPQAGSMILFPSWLNHCVHPVHGDAERISIAFNLMAALGDA